MPGVIFYFQQTHHSQDRETDKNTNGLLRLFDAVACLYEIIGGSGLVLEKDINLLKIYR